MDNPKKKPGRPRVTGRKPSEGQPILSARVGRDMYTAAVELAAADGISLAEWVRNALIGAIRQKKKPASKRRRAFLLDSVTVWPKSIAHNERVLPCD